MFLKLKFERKSSLIHGLDPRAKLLLAAALLSFAFADQPAVQLALFAASCFISIIGMVSRAFAKIAFSSIPVLLFIFLMNFFYSGFEYALEISLRFLNIISIFSATFLTTTPEELGLALEALKLPSTFSFILVSAARFTYTLSREAEEILQAYKARGGTGGRGIADSLRAFKAILIPLISISIRRSLTMAEALEMRGFGKAKRTSMRELKISGKDIMVITISLALLAIRITGAGI